MPIQRVLSKWAKTEALLADPNMVPYIPETRPFTRSTVKDMLEKLGMIYVKPVNGTFGNGVIRVEKKVGRTLPYAFQSGERKYRYAAFDEMFEMLRKIKLSKPYLVQQGIELITYRHRRFDLRVMVQKNTHLKWEATGIIGRLAHPRKIVTNYHSGGTPMSANVLLGAYIPEAQFGKFQKGLEKLGVLTGSVLERKYPRLMEIGLDIAVDRNLKPWILEVNTFPDPFIFRKHPDPSVFRRIYRYAVAYGRFARKR